MTRVIKTTNEKGEDEVSMVVDASEAKKVPGMVNKILARKGLPVLPKEEIEKHVKREKDEAPWVEMKLEVDLNDWFREVVKVAYEMAYLWLGEDYLTDPMAAELQACLNDRSDEADWRGKYPNVKARVEPFGELLADFRGLKGNFCTIQTNGDNDLVCIVGLVGISEGVVIVSRNPERYRFGGRIYLQDLETREVIDIPL